MGKLKYFCEIVGKPVEYFEGTKDYYSTGAVGSEKLVEEVTYEGRTGRANLQLKATDIIIAKMQNTDKTTVIDEESAKNIYSTGFMALNSSKMDNKFLYYLLQSPEFEFEKDMNSYGTTQVAISEQNFKTIDIEFVKDKKEQQIIATFLDQKVGQADKTIESLESQVEKLTEYKKSLITEVVTKGLDRDVEMKDSGVEWVGEIPKDWEVSKVKYVTKYNTDSLKERTHGGYKFRYVDIGNVKFLEGIVDYEETSFEESSPRARRRVKKGDTIISTVRTYLKAITRITDGDDVIVSTGFAVITPVNIEDKYLEYYCKSEIFCQEMTKRSYGIAYPSINSSELVNISLMLPHKQLQLEIVNYLDQKVEQVDIIIQQKQSQIQIMNKYKKSLIYEYVTGKKRVKGSEQLGS